MRLDLERRDHVRSVARRGVDALCVCAVAVGVDAAIAVNATTTFVAAVAGIIVFAAVRHRSDAAGAVEDGVVVERGGGQEGERACYFAVLGGVGLGLLADFVVG